MKRYIHKMKYYSLEMHIAFFFGRARFARERAILEGEILSYSKYPITERELISALNDHVVTQ